MDSVGPQSFVFGRFRLDPGRRRLMRANGAPVEITAKAFDALVYFLERPGVLIERSVLLDALWPDTVVEENNLSQTIAALRRVLGDGYIVTVRGRGYQFVAGVEVSASGAPAAPRDAARRAQVVRRFVYASAAALALAIGVAAVHILVPSSGGPASGNRAAPKVAVLPCDNLSPESDDAYLALSMHDEILTRLGGIEGLVVVSRSSMMQYAERRPSIPEIARELGAQAVMECTVRYSGADIVVSATLVDPATDSPLWSQSYPGRFDDVQALVALQADIAARTAESLGVQRLPPEQQQAGRPPTESHVAYAHYLRARQILTQQGYNDGYASDAFHEYVDRALDADPGFAAALENRGFGHLMRAAEALTAMLAVPDADIERRIAERELLLAARDAAAALDIDPDMGRAHALAGAVDVLSGDPEPAKARFERAVELTPNDAEILSFVMGFYVRDGRLDEALTLLEQVRRLNPIDHDVGYFFYMVGDRDTARLILRRVLARNPAHIQAHAHLGYLAAIDGHAAEAERELRLTEELWMQSEAAARGEPLEPTSLSTLAYSYGRIGLDDDVRRLADEFMRVVERTPAPPIRWMELHLALGDVEQAYRWASRAAERPLLPFVSTELEFVLNSYNDPVFEEPRFVEVRRKLGASKLSSLFAGPDAR